ncbi:MAG: hypothetical protein SGBAC_007078, partial [Bacillariaceae sp.]
QSHSGSDSVYTQASTVRVANSNEEIMALSQQQQQQSQPEQQQQQEEDYDILNNPLSCMDSACEAMIALFGAGGDAHDDEEMTTISSMATSTYTTNTYTGMLTWETPQHGKTQEEQDPPRVLS